MPSTGRLVVKAKVPGTRVHHDLVGPLDVRYLPADANTLRDVSVGAA